MAIVYQISLHGDAFDGRGKDWPELIAESGCKPRREWKDPLLGRDLLKTEFACSVSHFRVWQKIVRSGVAGIILEEDAVFSSFDVSEIDGLLRSYDSVWLGYRENTLGYWYNAHAYAITPKTAAMLCEGFENDIIPADEWLPHKLKSFSNYFYKPELVKQIPRSIRPSEIEGGSMQNHVITFGANEERMWALKRSAERYDISYLNLAKGFELHNDENEENFGSQKINAVRQHLQSLPDEDTVLFVNGYDILFCDNLETILERFNGFGCDIVFSAERNCRPVSSLASEFPITSGPYQYLNSGAYIGKVGALNKFFNAPLEDGLSDQLWMQQRFLGERKLNMVLDHEGYIFQCDDEVSIIHGQISNGICCSCIYHGNGAASAVARFLAIAAHFNLVNPNIPREFFSFNLLKKVF